MRGVTVPLFATQSDKITTKKPKSLTGTIGGLFATLSAFIIYGRVMQPAVLGIKTKQSSHVSYKSQITRS